ncbi:synaptonemal complex central element protein 1-like isoform X3 [Pan troglodytes]|uniref:synaptonemal complex central element protein 1-like isoform X3 n=1 Tax=Pan troglodytes TaxID=9598 RepID=UPI0023F20664|nr:synaptonemal complex central element protein 1-like isoform X3 [Pan troglodytes]
MHSWMYIFCPPFLHTNGNAVGFAPCFAFCGKPGSQCAPSIYIRAEAVLAREGSLEPQIEDLISRINELQQEALRILQMHCQEKESEAQRLDVRGQLEDLMGRHKDLWEFHMLEQRLAREIRALERSKEQLLSERRLVRAKLREVERRLRSPPEVQGAMAVNDGLKAELEIFGEQVQSAPEVGAGEGEPHPAPGRPDLSSPALATRRIRSRRWLPLTPSRPAGPARSRPSLETRQEIKAVISDHARVLPGVCATRWSGAGRPGISRRGLCRTPPTSRAPGAVQRLGKCS